MSDRGQDLRPPLPEEDELRGDPPHVQDGNDDHSAHHADHHVHQGIGHRGTAVGPRNQSGNQLSLDMCLGVEKITDECIKSKFFAV